MRLLKMLIVLALASPTWAAITEYYVTTTGAGSKDGTSEANAHSWTELNDAMTAGGSYTAAAGNRYNIKSGTYSISSTDTWTVDGTTAAPIVFRGYNSTIGDLDTQGRTGGNGALDTTDYPDIVYGSGYRLNAGDAKYIIFVNLDVAGTYNGSLVDTTYYGTMMRCRVSNSSTGAAAVAIDATCVVNCDASIGASGGSRVISADFAIACRITSSPSIGLRIGYGGVAIGNVVSSCATQGIRFHATNLDRQFVCINNTVHGCTEAGIAFANSAFLLPHIVMNNHVTDCGTNGFYSEYDGTAQLSALFINNRTRDNTSGAINGWDDWASATSWGHVTTDTGGASTDFTNAGSNDFSLISTAPGKATGLLPYMDIGALQRQESGGGATISRARVVNAN